MVGKRPSGRSETIGARKASGMEIFSAVVEDSMERYEEGMT